jgi:hypothetical protein
VGVGGRSAAPYIGRRCRRRPRRQGPENLTAHTHRHQPSFRSPENLPVLPLPARLVGLSSRRLKKPPDFFSLAVIRLVPAQPDAAQCWPTPPPSPGAAMSATDTVGAAAILGVHATPQPPAPRPYKTRAPHPSWPSHLPLLPAPVLEPSRAPPPPALPFDSPPPLIFGENEQH